MNMPHREGVLVHVSSTGLAVVQDNQSNDQFPFTFDKIKNYHGESANTINLHSGSTVTFSLVNDKVAEVELKP